MIQLGNPPLRIDLLTSISGVTFADCWHRRAVVDIGGIEAGFISLDDFIAKKLASGRAQDLVDAATLRRNLETE